MRVSDGGRKGGQEGGREEGREGGEGVEMDTFSLEALAKWERRREELASLPTVELGGRERRRPAVRADSVSIYAYM